MTDQEAFLLIEENIRLLRETFHWGQITIEVNEGVIKRINLTTNIRPKIPQDDGIIYSKKQT